MAATAERRRLADMAAGRADVLRFDLHDPIWPNRDRSVLSVPADPKAFAGRDASGTVLNASASASSV